LRLIADGRAIRAISHDGSRYIFALPSGASSVRLASRTGVPSDLTPYLGDDRQLGVAVRRIVVRTGKDMAEVALDNPALNAGWYQPERNEAVTWRWTDGNAILPVSTTAAPAMVEIQVVGTAIQYLIDSQAAERLAA
jgi:hypothetical protein